MDDKQFSELYRRMIRSLLPEPGHRELLLQLLLIRLLQPEPPAPVPAEQNRRREE